MGRSPGTTTDGDGSAAAPTAWPSGENLSLADELGHRRDEDVARLSPFVRHHVNMLGRYSFQLPALPGGLRTPRDPDAAEA
ncbi:hypothetical protein ACFWJ4_34745 [Kitasatospora sp. NPDC127067]|uniref:hypothetical protein n=1 Tax=Kitasatospora sp. NPDC127067 TaxID=3347126 RepID=UPI003654D3F7